MSFAMRVNFVDVICDDSLRNDYINGKISGYSFDVRLSYYRGHFLSDIDRLTVTVDDVPVPDEHIFFCINDKELSIYEIREAYTEFWSLLTPATIKVEAPGGLKAGAHHVKLDLMLRVPYLPLPGGSGDHCYMPLDAGGEKRLEVR